MYFMPGTFICALMVMNSIGIVRDQLAQSCRVGKQIARLRQGDSYSWNYLAIIPSPSVLGERDDGV
jgi:hypothetical protein